LTESNQKSAGHQPAFRLRNKHTFSGYLSQIFLLEH
jgi:hypothetical protein